ncbi:MAG: hypothetical protein GC178_09045 [Flavobacteriales bacterium]|nr:hypothetical protein [Flavobacteriales bacterium]
MKARLIFPFLLLLIAFQSFGQISFDSQEDLEKAANEFFEKEDYAKAKPLFSQLLSKDALNPNYNYRFGVCILFTEADPLKPLPYIEGGANSPGVNSEAYYYLGKAYQLNYRFDDAVKAYEKGKNAGFSSPKIDLDRSMQECRNGKILYNAAIDFQPAMDKEVIASEFYRPYDFRKLKGKVIPMPPNFKTKYDEKNLVGTVIYTPMNSEVLVYASYGEDGANAKDLYRVNRLPNGEWAIPQRLPNVINTKYDEDYAFYDEESQTLFFASKGHNTMGGYDVFSSKYDPNANTWSTPMNLQFPINSPFDDFLYVSDPEGKLAFFTSGRNTEAGKLRVLKTLLHDPNQVEVSVVEGMYEDLTDSVYNYAALTVVDPQTNEVVGKYRSNKLSGKYLLILPPQNDYRLDVGPKEANGFMFDLDVPVHESYDALQQQITYNSVNDEATVAMTNYFDAAGKPDTVKFSESRSLKEVMAQMAEMPELTAEELAQMNPKENALKAAQLAQAKQDSIRKAEELALKKKEEEAQLLAQQQAEKARLDSLKRVEELAAAQAKARQDSIQKVQQLALAQKKAEQARLDSIKQAEALALQQAKQAEMAAKLAKEKAEKAKLDSLKRVEQLALAQEKSRQDSIEKAVQLALEQKQAEQARQDSIKQAEALAFEQTRQAELAAKAEKEKAAKARLDSLKAAEAANLAMLQKRAVEAKQAKLDSLRKAEEMAFEKQRLEVAEREKQAAKEEAAKEAGKLAQAEVNGQQQQGQLDSLKRAEVLAAHEKAREDFIYKAEQLAEEYRQAKQQQQDSIKAAEEEAALAMELKEEEDAMLAEEKTMDRTLAEKKAREDSIALARTLMQVAREEALKAEIVLRQRQKAVADSLAAVELAQQAQEKAIADSIVKAEKQLVQEKLAAAKAEQERTRKRAQAKADSIAAAELAQKTEREKAMADSVAEVARLAEIKREVELAKQRALRDSMIVKDVAVSEEETESEKELTYSEILKEMAAKEAEILEQQGEEKRNDAIPESVTATSDTSKKVDGSESDIALEDAKVVSESELFLETIAKMEQQRKEQEALIAAENKAREEAKAQAKAEKELKQQQAVQSPQKLVTDGVDSALVVTGDKIAAAKIDSNATRVEEPLDGELESVALKSDADPNAYLAALNEIEAEMEKEAKSRPDKDYTLRSMDELQGRSDDKNADPVLQAKIDADRKALQEHQKEAIAKEEALKEEMQKDRQVVESYKDGLADELREAENEVVLNQTEPKKETETITLNEFLTKKGEKKTDAVAPTVDQQEVAAAEAEWDKEAEEIVQQPQTEAEKKETPVEKQFEEVEGSGLLIEQEKDAILEELAQIDSVQPEENKAVEEEVVMMESEPAPKDRAVIEEEVLEAENTPEPKEVEPMVDVEMEKEAEEVAVVQAEEIATEAETEKELADLETEPEEEVISLDAPQPASVGTVGTIPFLVAAKRDYSISKPSFDKVQNPDVRKMIKRMRAEDVGRLAVLKNMKNEWIEAGKTQESLTEIKGNRRNQDVLANQVSHPREEYIRPPFNKYDLRKRKDVYYKLEFVMEPAGVSETVSDAMSPESAITFSMPSVQLSTGYFQTLADVRSELKEYQNRGFSSVRIVPYLNDAKVALTDVQDVPFVD